MNKKFKMVLTTAVFCGILGAQTGVSNAQKKYGDTVFFERPPTVEELNKLFARKSTKERRSRVRKITLPTAPPPNSSPTGQPSDQSNETLALPIHFKLNSAEIQQEFVGYIASVAGYLKENNNTHVRIAGHADSLGSDQTNLVLSDQRAAQVKKYLVQQYQIDPNRLTSEGFGESEPLPSLQSNDPRNRRVEFQFSR